MTIYRVTGIFRYRGHKPGDTFVATLDPREEDRAILRGNIEVIERLPLGLDPARIRRPKG